MKKKWRFFMKAGSVAQNVAKETYRGYQTWDLVGR